MLALVSFLPSCRGVQIIFESFDLVLVRCYRFTFVTGYLSESLDCLVEIGDASLVLLRCYRSCGISNLSSSSTRECNGRLLDDRVELSSAGPYAFGAILILGVCCLRASVTNDNMLF